MKQAWNCAGVLLPPLRLANLAFVVGMNGLRKNVPETVAQLSGSHPDHVQRLLHGPAPTTEEELIALGRELEDLRRRVEGSRI